MRFFCLTFQLAVALALCVVGRAQSVAPRFYSVPGADAPELAAWGSYSVGVRTLALVNPGQIDILNFDKQTGKAPLYDRALTVEVWYPATIPQGTQEQTIYQSI